MSQDAAQRFLECQMANFFGYVFVELHASEPDGFSQKLIALSTNDESTYPNLFDQIEAAFNEALDVTSALSLVCSCDSAGFIRRCLMHCALSVLSRVDQFDNLNSPQNQGNVQFVAKFSQEFRMIFETDIGDVISLASFSRKKPGRERFVLRSLFAQRYPQA